MLAGRAVRRLGGRNPELAYRRRLMHTRRKIVSAIGMTEICPVRCAAHDVAEPLPSFGEIGMMAAVAADGFVIVPEASEGHPEPSPSRAGSNSLMWSIATRRRRDFSST